MAYTFTHSTVPGDTRDGGDILYLLKEALKAQGWTHVASGDGLALFSTVTDQITHGGSGVGGFDNTRAWITLQQPSGGSGAYAGTRQWTFQIGDGAGGGFGSTVRVVYSPGGTAVTGACDADTCPTFVDEVSFCGGGTPAAPTFEAQNAGQFGVYGKLHIVIGGAAENFGFWMTMTMYTDLQYQIWTWMFDPVLQPIAGDDDPFVLFSGTVRHPSGGATPFRSSDTGWMNQSPDWTWMLAKFAVSGYQGVSADGGMNGLASNNTVTNSRNNRDDLHPVVYSRHHTNGGYKGYSTFMRRLAVQRGPHSLLNVSATGDRVKWGNAANCWTAFAPWDNTVP